MNGEVATGNRFWHIFFSVDYDLSIVTGDKLVSGKYKQHNVFIVCIPSNQIQLSILGFLIVMEKPIRADALAE